MILELDVGNSRIKWRILGADGQELDQGKVTDLLALKSEFEQRAAPRHVRICSVRRGEALAEVIVWLADAYSLTPLIAKVNSSCGKVRNQYQDPSRLGVDRWLAMLAAYQRVKGACIVIDGGTALTLDILDHDGLHQGGYILPGLTLMERSLEENTAIRLTTQALVPSIAPGHSTDQAVRQGILAAIVALIEKNQAKQLESNKALQLVITGGDATTLADALQHAAIAGSSEGDSIMQHTIVRDLVLDGLAIACPITQGSK